jgi:hypothetical protein
MPARAQAVQPGAFRVLHRAPHSPNTYASAVYSLPAGSSFADLRLDARHDFLSVAIFLDVLAELNVETEPDLSTAGWLVVEVPGVLTLRPGTAGAVTQLPDVLVAVRGDRAAVLQRASIETAHLLPLSLRRGLRGFDSIGFLSGLE